MKNVFGFYMVRFQVSHSRQKLETFKKPIELGAIIIQQLYEIIYSAIKALIKVIPLRQKPNCSGIRLCMRSVTYIRSYTCTYTSSVLQ